MLARASVALAHLRHPEVIILISTVIEHLVKGEVCILLLKFLCCELSVPSKKT
jgi:geranylgeranyl pyrophosphate synthase